MRKALLVDADSTIPNLALMKLSTFFKSRGTQVDLVRLEIPYYPEKRKPEYTVNTEGYDIALASCIFNNSWELVKGDKIQFGGTGSNNKRVLPEFVDSLEPDYSIYPDNEFAYGFISRGCNRKCYFCVVPEKEGRVRQVSDIDRIVGDFKKVKFMDNNFLQLPNHVELLEELISKNIKCQFNQGLDIRMVTEENSTLLQQVNYFGEYIFAFDDYKYRAFVEKKLKLLSWRKPWRFKFFVYTHPDMSFGEVVKRIVWCQENECLPYVMRDVACFSSANRDFYTDLAAYANQPNIVKKMTFEQFLNKRHTKQVRIDTSLSKWLDGMREPDRKVFEIAKAS